jgi:hypothetical protein
MSMPAASGSNTTDLRSRFSPRFAIVGSLLTDLFGHRLSADRLMHAGDQLPIKPKAGTMPAYDSIGRDHNQCLSPGRPEAIKEDPEQFIQHGKSGAAALSLEHCQLLTQSEIFNQQNLARVKQPNEDASPKPQRTEHGLNSYQNAG